MQIFNALRQMSDDYYLRLELPKLCWPGLPVLGRVPGVPHGHARPLNQPRALEAGDVQGLPHQTSPIHPRQRYYLQHLPPGRHHAGKEPAAGQPPPIQ